MYMESCKFQLTTKELDDCISLLETKTFKNSSDAEKRDVINLLTTKLDRLSSIRDRIINEYGSLETWIEK